MAPGEGERLQLGLDTGCALCASASCWQETARAVGAATWRAGADTRASNLGGATKQPPHLALTFPLADLRPASALTDTGGVPARLSP